MTWSAKDYQEKTAFISELGVPLVELLAPQPDDIILDLGCGDGRLTQQIVKIAPNTIGLDASQDMVEACQAKGIKAQLGSADKLNFLNEFDKVFSNACLHWISDTKALLGGVNKALKPNGCFVAECGGVKNLNHLIDAMQTAAQGLGFELINPWTFLSEAEYANTLKEAGFVNIRTQYFKRPTPIKGHLMDWLLVFDHALLPSGLSDSKKQAWREETVKVSESQLYDPLSGQWVLDYTRLRIFAEKP